MSASFASEPYLHERYTLLARQGGLRAATASELLAWQHETRTRLRTLTGMETMRLCPPDAQLDTPVQCDGYSRQRITIATEPGVVMPFYALMPDNAGACPPVVIAAHGHGGGGKESVAGRRDLPFIAAAIDQYHYDYGVQLVRAGFVVLCPDARGFGERREAAMQGDDRDSVLGGSCRLINNMALPLGQSVIGMWTWDLMRLIDYATTRGDWDAARLGCVGLSGGGAQALWLAALDERVRAVVDSGYFYGYRDSLLHLNGNCSCNYVPGLWQLVDMGDLGALVAPRPLLVESGASDHLNGPRGVENVVEQLAITRRAYELTGSDRLLRHQVFAGEHRWDGAGVAGWLGEVL